MANYDDTATVSGSVVGFSNGADDVPMKSVVAHIAPTLTGTNAVNMVQTGSNLFNEDWEIGDINDTTGLPNSDTNKIRSKSFSVIKGGTTCYVSVPQPIRVLFYASDESFISETANIRNNSFTVPSNCSLFKIRGTVDYGTTYNNDIMISYGSTASSYEPYTEPTTYTANLGRTVYGADVDLVSGQGTSDGAVVTLDDTMSYGINLGTDTNRIAVTFYNSVGKINGTFASNVLTVGENTTGGYKSEPWVIWGSTSASRMWISVPTSIDTVDKFKQYLQSNTITIAYELATGTDFTFDGQEIPSMLGVNNLWSDQGNVEVTYYKDGYGFTSVTVHKETPDGEPVEETRKLHRIIYEGQVDVINGTGLIYRGESGTQYDPPEQISFTPIEVSTDEGENTLYADEGDSAITYRKAVD